MDKNVYEEFFLKEETFWWFKGTRKIIFSLLDNYLNNSRPTILDIGCGTGIVAKELEKYGTVYGVDKSRIAVDYCRKRGLDNIIESNAVSLPFEDAAFDLILCLDVLEHISNEEDAVSEILRVLKKDGLVIVNVPAFNLLWSEHDEAVNHCRRYGMSSIKKLFKKFDFSVLRSSYYNTILFPLIALIRIGKRTIKKFINKNNTQKTDISNLPGFINNILLAIMNIEKIILKRFTLPFGLSIFLILQKN